MKTRILISTAVGLLSATAAFAQAPSPTTNPAPAASQQNLAPSTSTAPSTAQKAQTPPNSSSSPSSSPSLQAQTVPSSSPATTAQPSPAQTSTQPPAAGQAQQAPATNQTQSAPAGTGTTTAQQPTQPSQTSPTQGTAQTPQTNVSASININDQQRTRLTESITRLNVQPLTNVNFSLTAGTIIPRDVSLRTLPPDVVEVVPQYRGYSFFVVRNEIVIVEPSTYKIVTVIPRHTSSAAAPARTRSSVSFTDKDRDVVRKHVKTRTIQRHTTGSASEVVIRRGERVPETVEVEEFPETVYREAPALREYRYIRRENRTYLVDPGERRVIEEID